MGKNLDNVSLTFCRIYLGQENGHGNHAIVYTLPIYVCMSQIKVEKSSLMYGYLPFYAAGLL